MEQQVPKMSFNINFCNMLFYKMDNRSWSWHYSFNHDNIRNFKNILSSTRQVVLHLCFSLFLQYWQFLQKLVSTTAFRIQTEKSLFGIEEQKPRTFCCRYPSRLFQCWPQNVNRWHHYRQLLKCSNRFKCSRWLFLD